MRLHCFVLLLSRDGQLFSLVLELARLKKERQGDPDEGHAREEHADWLERLSDLGPSAQRHVVDMQEQDDGCGYADADQHQADYQGDADGCGSRPSATHRKTITVKQTQPPA